ncbi:hypothetical protein MBCUT_03210 [Methanobrevibacter cuticularis]|uniref:Uncharacterized protein n=1 Tax=Methanobrevibacter cuticularis TaxID=47311 RepID=A0A166F3D8_9EURY|nr:KEOPS complex subunit Pcc1 [Methanobrevibacter cuticularis]KZX17274.1 hypothetical protein MBCUT_03210 [Methanobrevibacter cuticularis]
MKIDAKIQIEYGNSKDADISFQSLEVENKGFIKSNKEENILNYNLSAESLSTFLSTVDDLIFSEILVEKVLKSTSTPKHQ